MDPADRHKAKMVKRKAVQDAEVAAKPILEKGLLIVHTGPGKGKSTAAFGLALRALGRGFRVGVVQFIKGAWSTGERIGRRALRDPGRMAHDGRGLHLGDAGPRPRRRGGLGRLGRGEAHDGRPLDPPARARRAQHRAPLRLSAARRSRRGARRAAPRSACRRHRPQRQAGADRSGRLRHRIRPRQASLRRRRARAAGRSSFDRPGADVSGRRGRTSANR